MNQGFENEGAKQPISEEEARNPEFFQTISEAEFCEQLKMMGPETKGKIRTILYECLQRREDKLMTPTLKRAIELIDESIAEKEK